MDEDQQSGVEAKRQQSITSTALQDQRSIAQKVVLLKVVAILTILFGLFTLLNLFFTAVLLGAWGTGELSLRGVQLAPLFFVIVLIGAVLFLWIGFQLLVSKNKKFVSSWLTAQAAFAILGTLSSAISLVNSPSRSGEELTRVILGVGIFVFSLATLQKVRQL
jgi:hypothetical protein